MFKKLWFFVLVVFSTQAFAQEAPTSCADLSFQVNSGSVNWKGKDHPVRPQVFPLECEVTRSNVSFKWTNEYTSMTITFTITRTRQGVVYVDTETGTRFTMPRMDTPVCGMLQDKHLSVHACLLPANFRL